MSKLLQALTEGEYHIDPANAEWTPKNVVNAIMGCLVTYADNPLDGVRDMLGSLDRDTLIRIYNEHFGRPSGPGERPFPPKA